MFCVSCGNKISDEAQFCPFCGFKTPSAAPQDSPTHEPEIETTQSVAADTQEEPIASDSPAANDGLSADSLKAAVDSTRKRSRRRMPLILVVALALALASSAAFAAHYVYTNIWLPSHNAGQAATTSSEGTTAVWVVDTETVTTSEGEAVTTSSYEYDNLGQLTTESVISHYLGETISYMYEYEYSDGRISAIDETEHEANRYQFEYNEIGECTTYTWSNSITQEVYGSCSYAYNDSGVLDTITYTYEDEVIEYKCTVNDNGSISLSYLTASDYSSAGSGPVGKAPITYSDATYDENGNLISVSNSQGYVYTYTYKQIDVDAATWIPNPYSNPTVGTGNLTSAPAAASFATYYSLGEERIAEIKGE